MQDFTPVTNGVISSGRLCLYVRSTDGVTSSSLLYLSVRFSPITNGVVSFSPLCLYVRFYASN